MNYKITIFTELYKNMIHSYNLLHFINLSLMFPDSMSNGMAIRQQFHFNPSSEQVFVYLGQNVSQIQRPAVVRGLNTVALKKTTPCGKRREFL